MTNSFSWTRGLGIADEKRTNTENSAERNVPALRGPTLGICNRSEGTEFSGGWLTGPLLHMKDIGTLLFIAALLFTFFYRRVAGLIMVVASMLCLPLYLYFTAPGPFRWVFRGEYSVPAPASFVWSTWGMVGILGLAIAACLGVRSLLERSQKSVSSGTAAAQQTPAKVR
jgi:hypothetical protein